MHEFNNRQANEARAAAALNYVVPSAAHTSYEGAGSQDTAIGNVKLPSRETSSPREEHEALFSGPSTPTPPPQDSRPSAISLPTREAFVPSQETNQPCDVEQNADTSFPHQVPFGGASYPIPAGVGTVNPSNVVGASAQTQPSVVVPPPRITSGGAFAGSSRRRKPSTSAEIPPAKRARRVAQPNVPETTEGEIDAKDVSRGFVDTNLPPEVQQAMRDLVVAIRTSQFITDKTLEPTIGTTEATSLMAVASSELWTGYGTKARSIYSLFIRVEGENCKCLWCGDVQHDGKLQRALGHFRAKHFDHEPCLCGEIHVGEELW